ncbi:C-terminal domain of CinA type S [Alloactinosynnema sp. L-07]|uniref:CinA family protein n=1 Tax=Alloactinosynnema sp. L-07 TaxID=1653480 RepID=UPI00065EF565|nr:CinA family protein [Alloactinosynnema sp. L-07]CRK58466.1 C-terminal domain of CinA type S [Alloactinosynnema sp. L-07]
MTQLRLVPGLSYEPVAALIDRLRECGQTVATAESLTAGLVAAVLTSVPGSSAVVRGGVVVYGTDLKADLAGVDADLLAERGAVDEEVARQLADGARTRCGATIGVGLTGVAGPDPQDGVAVGTVWVALSGPRGSRAVRLTVSGGREDVRAAAVRGALDLLAAEVDTLIE